MISIFSFILFGAVAFSADDLKFPLSFSVYSETDDSRLDFECASKDPNDVIYCQSVQTMVSTSDRGEIPDFATLPKDQLEKTFHSLRKDCGSVKKFKPISIRESAKSAELEDIDTAKMFCDCAGTKKDAAECMNGYVRTTEERKKHTCKISSTSFEGEFKRNGPYRWTRTSEQGACDFFLVSTLEYRNRKWTFRQTRIGDAKKLSGLCAAFDINKPLVYSTNGGSTFNIKCDRISF